jgi:hypothetical protein
MLRFFFPPKTLHGAAVGNVSVVIVTIGFDRLFGENGSLLVAAGGKIGAAKDVPGTFTVALTLDGTLSQ